MASIVSFHPQKGLNPAGGKKTRAKNIQKTGKMVRLRSRHRLTRASILSDLKQLQYVREC